MGAWIETALMHAAVETATQSHPMWVRGLKLVTLWQLVPNLAVAPHVGAWIETLSRYRLSAKCHVAPHVGAWIETVSDSVIWNRQRVAPHVGAWIETGQRCKVDE